jgi:exodeoxyribonuclease VII large subunit
MFKGAVKNLKFRPGDGMGLIARGRISVYDQRGEYQLICEYLEPAGVGALQLAFMQLKERLAKEGLFDEGHKRPLPVFPRRVGVITSPTGAAIHDILNVLKRRFASVDILLCPVRVQGEGAAGEIACAIDDMNRLGLTDVLIVGRGGGSLEDLWPFNEEVVARAVHRSKLPVISAVGHETDWTICDFAADLRAPTPSAAAELVVASSVELRGRMEALDHRLRLSMETRLAGMEAHIDALRRSLHDPGTMLGHLAQRVDDLTGRLELALRNRAVQSRGQFEKLQTGLMHANPARTVENLRQKLSQLSTGCERLMTGKLEMMKHAVANSTARLDVLSPLQTLARGYAIATGDRGTVITDSGQLASGDRVRLYLHRGRALCRVEELEKP